MNTLVPLVVVRMRRDAVQLTLWILGTAALASLTYVGVSESYGTEQDRMALLATAAANPVILLFRGLPSGAEPGAFLAFLILPFLVMLAAFMSSFLAVRHTRMDEEQGRAELVGATPAGRASALSATVIHGTLANVVLAVFVTAAVSITGLGFAGAATVGLATGAAGVAFLAISLLLAQLVRTSRGANSAGVWVIVATYLACGIGNAAGTPSADAQHIESGWLAWLSPFGWAENTRPYDADNLLPLLLCIGLAALCIGGAYALQGTRDLGESLLPERLGPVHARESLAGPVGLAWRLSRGAIVGWMIGGLLTGLLATRLADVLAQVGAQIPSVQTLATALAAGGSLAQAAVVIFFTMLGILAACCAVQTVSRTRQEEAHGTAEFVLAGSVSRLRWLGSYALVAALGIIGTIAAAVLGAAVGLASLASPDWSLMGDVLVTGAGQIAAAGVFLVIATVLLVTVPRWTIPIGWTAVMVGMIVGLFGPLFGFPSAVVNLSPIAVAPTVTASGVDLRGLVWLLVAIVIGATATVLFTRRRELTSDG